jgi:hypothetical protein
VGAGPKSLGLGGADHLSTRIAKFHSCVAIGAYQYRVGTTTTAQYVWGD